MALLIKKNNCKIIDNIHQTFINNKNSDTNLPEVVVRNIDITTQELIIIIT